MRALICKAYGPPESLEFEETDDPVPGEGEVLIGVAAAGINFPDVLAIAGQYQVKTPTPFVPGNEVSGIVAATGAGVERWSAGDRVIANTKGGAFAEQCVADQNTVMRHPDCLDFAQGAGFSVTYGTSFHALRQRADLQPDETLLVLGAAGGVGIAAIEIAKAMGARVIAAASSDKKLQFAKVSGADELINYAQQPLNETVKELTGGEGVDVVYDPVGGDLADQALRATAWHGRYLVVGFASGQIPRFAANIALLKEASILGVWWGTWAAKNVALQIRNMQEIVKLVADGKLTPRITESYPLHEFVQAFAAITERRALGKVVLKVGAG